MSWLTVVEECDLRTRENEHTSQRTEAGGHVDFITKEGNWTFWVKTFHQSLKRLFHFQMTAEKILVFSFRVVEITVCEHNLTQWKEVVITWV